MESKEWKHKKSYRGFLSDVIKEGLETWVDRNQENSDREEGKT